MFNKKYTEVVVLGAGPVGLVAAHVLADRKVDFVLFDREKRVNTQSYALALHPDTLELLDRLNVVEPILERALRIRRVAIYDAQQQQGVVDYGLLPMKYPFLAVIGQNELEQILVEALERKGHKPRWGHRVRCIEPAESDVHMTVDRLIDGMTGYAVAHFEPEIDKIFKYSADYLLAADGYASQARTAAGIDFPETAESQDYAIFEFETNIKIPQEMRMIVDGDKTHIFWPLPDNRCRFSFQMESGFAKNASFNKDHSLIDEAAQQVPELSNAHLEELLQRHAPWFIGASDSVKWRAMVHFESHLAERFGRDRIWLVGDAAHLARPAGVLSMNVGMTEAADLADRIGLSLQDGLGYFSLKSYETDRLAEWRYLLNMGQSLQGTDSSAEWLLQHKANLVGNLPASGVTLASILGQLRLSQAA
ncbi:MAG: 2-polyprenyl-6-methoxyphenol hydroxylase-like FAD-dependent oxidoreductase [Lentimonas sp.]|jgi:2-polyprenyl-6-methoxyphenol hydroxylase-like FAD-dependent oxidoreductase